jgi:hypothetical protein
MIQCIFSIQLATLMQTYSAPVTPSISAHFMNGKTDMDKRLEKALKTTDKRLEYVALDLSIHTDISSVVSEWAQQNPDLMLRCCSSDLYTQDVQALFTRPAQ